MPDLASIFEENAVAAAAEVWRCACTPIAVRLAVEQIVELERGIVLCETEFLPPQIMDGLRGLASVLPKPTDQQLIKADVGVTEAFAGVASSGSVCISLGRPLVGASSLLMPIHIVLLQVERIVARPRDLFDPELLDGTASWRNLVIITGPSATADMGLLVYGAHGPRNLHILLLE
jgi:L-lactate dehydrogenase complex protein LldG